MFKISYIQHIFTKSIEHCTVCNVTDYNLSILSHGSETWKIKARDARGITAAEMKYMRITAGYTRTDYKTNKQIAKGLKITKILDKLLEYKRNWIKHVNRMLRKGNEIQPRVMRYYPG